MADTNEVGTETGSGAAPSMSWARTPPQRGIDLPVTAVLGIAVGMYLVSMALSWHVAGPFFTYVGWIHEPSVDGVTRQMLVPSSVHAALWLTVVTALGWRRAVGFGGGVMSWGIVPVVIFCLMLFVGVADPSISERGLPLLGVGLSSLLFALAHLHSMLGTGQRFVLPMMAFLFGHAVVYARIHPRRIRSGIRPLPTRS